jgi:hypothetical protein
MIPASLLTAGPWPYQGGLREIHLDADAADGANPTRLATDATPPAFSPDGRKIAFRGETSPRPTGATA